MGRSNRFTIALALAVSATALDAGAECPATETLLERLAAADASRASRTTRFQAEPPRALHEMAAHNVGEPLTARIEGRGHGVLIVRMAVEPLWKAANDEGHHALDGKYLPLKHSELLEGTPGDRDRLVFQYYTQMGVGRWWVNRVSINQELFRASKGALWEVVWVEEMDTIDPGRPPVDQASSRMAGMRINRGAWLLIPLGSSCTLIEHFSWAEAGGFAGAMQPMMLRRALRNTLEGLVRLAQEHVNDDDHATFVGPDGVALE